MTRFASMKKSLIAIAIIGICLASTYDDFDGDDDQGEQVQHHGGQLPEPIWENYPDYQEYRQGQYYLTAQFFLYDQNHKPLYNADNGKLLLGPDGKAITDYRGNKVYTPKDFEHLYDSHGQPKYGPKNGAVLYGPNCVPLLDCYGRCVYGPCIAIKIPPQPTPHPNPAPQPVPHPQHPNIPKWDVPYNPETPVPKPKPIPLPNPEPVPVRPPTPIQIPRPVWVPFTDYRIPIYVQPRPNLPKPFPLPKPEIPIPRGHPGYTPKRIPIFPPNPVLIPFPVYNGCIHLYFSNGVPIYSAQYGKKLTVKDSQGNDVWGPSNWPSLFDNYGRPLFNDDNGLPLNGPDGQLIRVSYPNGAIVYGPKLFYKPYPGDEYKGPVVVGDGYEEYDAEI